MDIQERSKLEYIARVNRVMDYIEEHIHSSLELEKLASVAHFSLYHFHRIFTLMVGETPNAFLQRVRLEKAAQLLNDDANSSITEIAYTCGFTNVSTFSRSFKKYWGITAKQYREKGKPLIISYSKNGQSLNKNGQRFYKTNRDLCDVELNKFIIMETKIEVKEMPEMNAVYCRHTGAFNQIVKAYDKLTKWAGPRGLLDNPNAKFITVYRDDPSVTPIEKVRQDACLTVSSNVKVDGEIGKITIAGGKYAVGHFEVVETEIEKAWNTMCLWFTESGYQPSDGNTFELYYNDQKDHPEGKFIFDICIPVKTL